MSDVTTQEAVQAVDSEELVLRAWDKCKAKWRSHDGAFPAYAFAVFREGYLTAAPAPALVSEAAEGASCDEQLAEAKRLAANVGYMVVPDPVHADGDVHEPDFVAHMQPSLRALGFHAVPLSQTATEASLAAATEDNAKLIAEAVAAERKACAWIAREIGNICNMLQNDNVEPAENITRREVAFRIDKAIRARATKDQPDV